ncbi:MAG: hypothetical protein IJ418_17695 [Clostridia bacterium]|nr:hypothetical protein [Clostridia bacterium]
MQANKKAGAVFLHRLLTLGKKKAGKNVYVYREKQWWYRYQETGLYTRSLEGVWHRSRARPVDAISEAECGKTQGAAKRRDYAGFPDRQLNVSYVLP